MSPRAVMWTCAGLLGALVVVFGVGFAWSDGDGGRTVSGVRDHLDPADDTVQELLAAVHDNETAYLNYLLTKDPGLLEQSQAQAVRATTQLARLHQYASSLPVLRAALPALDAQARVWKAATEAIRAGGGQTTGPANSERVAAGESLLAGTRQLAEALGQERDATWSAAFRDRGRTFVLVEVAAGVLFASLAAVAVVASRRFLVPLAALEKRMRQTAEGSLERVQEAGHGWLGGLAAESERLRLRLKESRGDARRDREALERDAETSIGLRRILTGAGHPGPGVDVHGVIVAAEGIIAGDFLDVVALSDGTTALVQGDISGHGVPAGLLASQAKSALTSALRLGYGPRAAVHAAWSALVHEDERFLTLAIAVIDPGSRTLSWINAGHEEPFLRRTDGRVERLAPTGPLVSSLFAPAATIWTVQHTPFTPGDLLVMTTDGLTEARNKGGGQLGDQEVENILHGLTATDPQTAVRQLYLAADRHGTDWQRDDITALAARLNDEHPH